MADQEPIRKRERDLAEAGGQARILADRVTFAERAQIVFTEKKSRFLGVALPLGEQDPATEAQDHLNLLWKDHPQATHICYAYLTQCPEKLTRYSDDGEPSGTAGLQILGALKARGINHGVCYVIRYFGGILLGTGGLHRAYTRGALEAIEAAGPAKIEVWPEFALPVPYALVDQVLYQCKQIPTVKILNQEYLDQVFIDLVVAPSHEADLKNCLRTLWAGKEPWTLTQYKEMTVPYAQ